MARSPIRHVVLDQRGNAVANAAVYVYQPGTTDPPTGTMYDAKTAGNVLTNPLISDSQGEVEVWLESSQAVELLVTDNSDQASLTGVNGTLSWTEYRVRASSMPETASDLAQEAGLIGAFVKARWKAGYYYNPRHSSRGTYASVIGRCTYQPLWVPAGASIDRIGTEVTTGTASAVARLGIYTSSGDGFPAGLLADFGTVDASTIGNKEITVSRSLPEGLYWLCVAPQVAAATFRSFAGFADLPVGVPTLSLASSGSIPCGYYGDDVTGALPASPALTSSTAVALASFVRAA